MSSVFDQLHYGSKEKIEEHHLCLRSFSFCRFIFLLIVPVCSAGNRKQVVSWNWQPMFTSDKYERDSAVIGIGLLCRRLAKL